MRLGVPKEIKNHEYRVGLVPSSVRKLVYYGHQVYVETNAGLGAGMNDADYPAAGATILYFCLTCSEFVAFKPIFVFISFKSKVALLRSA